MVIGTDVGWMYWDGCIGMDALGWMHWVGDVAVQRLYGYQKKIIFSITVLTMVIYFDIIVGKHNQ